MLWCHQSRFFISSRFYYLLLIDKLLTCFCSSSFLTCIIFGYYLNYLQSGASIHNFFENIKKALKSVVLAFLCDFSTENLSRTEATNISFSCYRIKSLTENTFLWRVTKLTCIGYLLVDKFFGFWHQFMCYSNNLTVESFFACLFLRRCMVYQYLRY